MTQEEILDNLYEENENFEGLKLCPLKFNLPTTVYHAKVFYCDKEKCAWWLKIQKACCVQVLARKDKE